MSLAGFVTGRPAHANPPPDPVGSPAALEALAAGLLARPTPPCPPALRAGSGGAAWAALRDDGTLDPAVWQDGPTRFFGGTCRPCGGDGHLNAARDHVCETCEGTGWNLTCGACGGAGCPRCMHYGLLTADVNPHEYDAPWDADVDHGAAPPRAGAAWYLAQHARAACTAEALLREAYTRTGQAPEPVRWWALDARDLVTLVGAPLLPGANAARDRALGQGRLRDPVPLGMAWTAAWRRHAGNPAAEPLGPALAPLLHAASVRTPPPRDTPFRPLLDIWRLGFGVIEDRDPARPAAQPGWILLLPSG